MGYLKYVRELWKNPSKNMKQEYKDKLISFRRENSVERVEKPTRIDRARTLGYRAKQGFVVSRVRVICGGKKNPKIRKGRDGGNLSNKITQSKNYQQICEERCQKRYPNLEVLNSYYVGKDERHIWYEVILVDTCHPQILSDRKVNWLCFKNTKRVFRGLTSSGKKSRGLRKKGIGAEKIRPSLKANKRLH